MNTMHTLARQQVSWDQEHATIEAGKRAFFPERERADAFDWAMRIYMIALAVGGIGYSILGAVA